LQPQRCAQECIELAERTIRHDHDKGRHKAPARILRDLLLKVPV
jgi:hypothetical protein